MVGELLHGLHHGAERAIAPQRRLIAIAEAAGHDDRVGVAKELSLCQT